MDDIAKKMPKRLVEGAATEEYFSQDNVWENLDGVAQSLDAPVWLVDLEGRTFATTNCIVLSSKIQQGWKAVGVGSTHLCYDCEPGLDVGSRFRLRLLRAEREVHTRFILATA